MRAEFNRCAGTYEENAGVQKRAASRLGEWIEFAGMRSGTALELGAGTGFFTRKILQKGWRVSATDIAPGMVARGRRNCPEAEWTIGDGWRLPPRCADLLASSSLLQWMPEPEKTLRVFREALRDGGRMLHGFFVAPSLRELYSLCDAGTLPVVWRTSGEWRELFEAAGLRILRAETETLRENYADVRAFLRTLKNSGATSRERQMPAGALRKLMREYAENFPDGNAGGVFATWSIFRVEAVRV